MAHPQPTLGRERTAPTLTQPCLSPAPLPPLLLAPLPLLLSRLLLLFECTVRGLTSCRLYFSRPAPGPCSDSVDEFVGPWVSLLSLSPPPRPSASCAAAFVHQSVRSLSFSRFVSDVVNAGDDQDRGPAAARSATSSLPTHTCSTADDDFAEFACVRRSLQPGSEIELRAAGNFSARPIA